MKVGLLYGSGELELDLPEERTVVVTPRHRPPAADAAGEVRRALRRPVPGGGAPLRERLRRGDTVAIAVCDGTRPQPRQVMLPVLLDEIGAVCDAADVVVLVATGTHRANTGSELEAMLGRDVLARVRVVNHDARDPGTLVELGPVNGVPVQLNRQWIDADVRITTGFVEPHFFAGFSGGPKLVAPGLAGLSTTLVLHDARHIGDPRATWGVRAGNPVHEDVRAIAASSGVHYACDVLLDRQRRIVSAFGGDLEAMHVAACAACADTAMVPVEEPFDVVVTSNAGFPLDQNLYQCVKGMSAAAGVVRDGGRVLLAAECRDGFPDYGSYRALLASGSSPAELLEAIRARPAAQPDQWQVQVQAQIQLRARVGVHTSGLAAAELAAAHLEAVADLAGAVRAELDAAGPRARCCVLPEGPVTVPYLAAPELRR